MYNTTILIHKFMIKETPTLAQYLVPLNDYQYKGIHHSHYIYEQFAFVNFSLVTNYKLQFSGCS